MIIPADFNTLVEINPKEGEDTVTVDIGLDRGRTLKGKLVGPDGEPVAGALMAGHGRATSRYGPTRPLPSAEFEVHSSGPKGKCGLLFYHEAKQLAGAYVVKPDEAGPVTVRLEPCGTLSGRLVDRGGLPQAGAWLTSDRPYREEGLAVRKGVAPDADQDRQGRAVPDLGPGPRPEIHPDLPGRAASVAGRAAKDVSHQGGRGQGPGGHQGGRLTRADRSMDHDRSR